MNFDTFKENVEKWAQERGIYEHSTVSAQLLKALSEIGELAGAMIKGQEKEIEDAIGDIAVCIVNASKMAGLDIGKPSFDFMNNEVDSRQLIGCIALTVGACLEDQAGELSNGNMQFILCCLVGICQRTHNPDFMVCCEQAWHEIKDRKGRMVAGGAFVKD